MKLSSLVLAASLALGSTAAMAGGGPLDLSSGSAGFSSTPAVGGFVDSYTFTLATTSLATASFTSVVNGLQDVDFMSVSLVGPSGFFAFMQLLPDPVEVWSLSPTTLAAGSYVMSIIGTNSAAGGSYGGNFAVTAVPEPETYALLLAGLVAMGFIARRRKA